MWIVFFRVIFGFDLHKTKYNANSVSVSDELCVAEVYVLTLCVVDLFPHGHPSAATTVSDIRRRHVSFYACRDTQSRRLIEINLCVLLGPSRGNQSWLNSAMTSISVRGNSSCYLIWLHNREARCPDSVHFSLVGWRNVTILGFFFYFNVGFTKKIHTCSTTYKNKQPNMHLHMQVILLYFTNRCKQILLRLRGLERFSYISYFNMFKSAATFSRMCTELEFEKPSVQFQWNVKLISFLLRHFKRSQQFIPYVNVPAIKELKVTREPSEESNLTKVFA